MMRLAFLTVLALSLGGCFQHTGSGGSVAGGESKVFERPPYVVLGKTRYDQNWVDSQIEGGVAAYGWQRPAPRPPELDTPVRKKAPPVKKPGLLKRLKDRAWPASAPPVLATPAPPPVVVAAPPPPPRDPVDELLNP